MCDHGFGTIICILLGSPVGLQWKILLPVSQSLSVVNSLVGGVGTHEAPIPV